MFCAPYQNHQHFFWEKMGLKVNSSRSLKQNKIKTKKKKAA